MTDLGQNEAVEELDRDGGPPLYVQLRNVLADLVRQAEPGELLFTDEQIAERYRVNRLTVRHAVEELVAQGLVRRVRGTGTVVSEQPVRSRFRAVERFFSEWSEQGRRIDVEMLAFERRPCPLPYAEWLGLRPGDEACYVQRRRWVDDEPMAIDHRYVRVEYARVLTRVDIVNRPLFETIDARLGTTVVDGYNELQAMGGGDDAVLMDLPDDHPVLRRRMVLFTEDRSPVLAGSTSYRGDRFIYSFGGEEGGDLRLHTDG